MTQPYNGPIVDGHHHLWRYSAVAYPWLAAPENADLARDVGPADYRAALAGHDVVATVWIEALAADPLAEARQAQAWAEAAPGICAAIVAHTPLDAPDITARLDRLVADVPNLRGIRDIVSWRGPGRSHARRGDLLTDPTFARGLAALADRGLVFDLMLLPHQLDDAARLLATLPELQVVVEHAASPEDKSATGLAQWRDGLARLAGLPNVAIKISALHCLDPDWTLAGLQATIDEIVAAFDVERTCFATDFPVHDRSRPAADALSDFKAATADRDPAAQRALFHDTACRLYRIEAPAPANPEGANRP